MVAALFHDVGKIFTLTHRMWRTFLGAAVDHDKLTLEVLAPPPAATRPGVAGRRAGVALLAHLEDVREDP